MKKKQTTSTSSKPKTKTSTKPKPSKTKTKPLTTPKLTPYNKLSKTTRGSKVESIPSNSITPNTPPTKHIDIDPLTGDPVFLPDPNTALVPDFKGEANPGDLSAPSKARVRVLANICRPVTRAKFRKFIQHLSKMGNVTMACASAGVAVRTMSRLREHSPEIRAVWDEAMEMSVDFFEAEGHRRAIEGVERIKYDRDGKLMQTERVYSDKIWESMMRAKRPGKYRDKEASLNVNIGIAFQSIGAGVPTVPAESVTKALQSPPIDVKPNE